MGNRIIGYKNKLWRVIHDFHCTESDQVFTLNKGKYLFICKGGAGGYSDRPNNHDDGHDVQIPSYGGVTYGVLTLNEDNNTFHAVVGGNGANLDITDLANHQLADQHGGFNGGAWGGESTDQSQWTAGCGGGGATDIRLMEYDPNEYPTYTNEGRFVEPANPHTRMYDPKYHNDDGVLEGYTVYSEMTVSMPDSSNVFIDTGYCPNTKTKIVTEFKTASSYISGSNDRSLFGAYNATGDASLGNQGLVYQPQSNGYSTRHKYWYNVNSGDGVLSGYSFDLNKWYQLTAGPTSYSVQNMSNDYTMSTTWSGNVSRSTMSGSLPITIFTANHGPNSSGSTTISETIGVANKEYYPCSMRYFKIYEDDVLLHHFVPCIRESDESKGMYDKITNTFHPFYNQEGENISITMSDTNYTYDIREYVQPSHGYRQNENSYRTAGGFVTNYIPTVDTCVEVDCVLLKRTCPESTWNCLFDSRVGDKNTEFGLFVRSGDDGFVPTARVGNEAFLYTSSDPDNKPLPFHQRIKVKMTINRVEWYVQDTLWGYIDIPGSTTPTFSQKMSVLWCINANSDGCPSQLFEMKVYENDTLVHRYLPCTRVYDGHMFLIDTIDGGVFILTYRDSSYPLYVKMGPKLREHPSMNSRIMVAGGGGGATPNDSTDNSMSHWSGRSFGGGAYGGPMVENNGRCGNGWLLTNQSFGYTFGYGIPALKRVSRSTWGCEGSGGAGGGWFGGFSSQTTYDGSYATVSGGGGSGYVYTANSFKPPGYNPPTKYQFTDITMICGQSNEGEAIICEEIASSQLQTDDMIEFPNVGEVTDLNLIPGKYRLTCYGGDGGFVYYPNKASRGGFAQGVVNLPMTTKTFVRVGGSGYIWSHDNGYGDTNTHSFAMVLMPFTGFNGGGQPVTRNNNLQTAGGGATDIRFEQDTLYHRAIVAGGGGGSASYGYDSLPSKNQGSDGGGLTSGNLATTSEVYVNGKSTQSEASTSYSSTIAGSFGQGGIGTIYNDSYVYTSAGGGGWFGGSGVTPPYRYGAHYAGAQGGSGYVLTESSWKPDEYQLDSKYYLSDTYLTIGGNTLPKHMSGATIEVLEAYKNTLAKDSDGYKYFDNTQNAWTLISPQPSKLTPSIFETYSDSFFVSDTGLQTNYKLYILDEDESVEKLALSITPDVVRIKAHTEMTADVLSESIDVDPYDETVFNYNIYTRKELIDDENKVQVYVDVEKLVQGDQKFKLYSASLTGKGGSSPQSSYRYMSLEDVTPTLDCDPDNPCYGTLVRPNGEMDDHRDDHGNIKVDQYLLPLKIGGTKNIPQEYETGLFESGTTIITSTMNYIYNRMVYVCSSVRWNDGNYVEISTYNFNTKRFSRLYRIPWYPNFDDNNDQYYGMTICGFLVDDDNFYIHSRGYHQSYSGRKYIRIVNKSTGAITKIANPTGNGLAGNFKRLLWYESAHRNILCFDDNGNNTKLCIMNVKSHQWQTIQLSTWTNSDSIYNMCCVCCSDKTVAVGYVNNSSYQFKVCLHDKTTDQSTMFSFGSDGDGNAASLDITYHDGKFYVAIRGGLRIIDEETKTVITNVSIPWGTHTNGGKGYIGPVEYCNGALFVPNPRTNWLYIYDLNKQTYNMLYLNWYIHWRDESNYYNHSSCAYNQLYFFSAGATLLEIDYLGGVKYNIGYKYNQYQVDYTTDNDELEYDPSCVTMTESCAIISDGLKQYVLNPYDEDHIASIDVSKKDYRYAYGMTSIHYEPEPEPEENSNEGDE